MKKCSKCERVKGLEDFYKSSNKFHKDGRQGYCKECSKAIDKEYYRHRKRQKYLREYREANKERINKQQHEANKRYRAKEKATSAKES